MLPWLCHHFNENSCMLKIDMMKEFSVSSYDVQDVFMLPNVIENKLTYKLRKQPIANMVIQKEWMKKLGILDSEDIFVNNLENKIKSLKEGGMILKDNVKEIRNLDRCGYVLNNLCKAVGSFKKNKHKESRTGISGCVLILQIVYFHHLSFRVQPEPIILPLIKHWTDEKVRKRIASEAKALFGQGEIQKDVERRLVSFNLPDGVMTDNEIHEAVHDEVEEDLLFLARDSTLFSMLHAERINCITDRIKMQKANLFALDSQLFSETQKLKEDHRVQRAIDEIVKIYDDLRDVSNVVAVDANTANQPVDGDDIDEEPNEDLANLVRSITKSILKDTVVQEKQPNVIKKATKKPIEKVYQVVVDYCFVKYSAFKHEELVKYEAPLMITRDDTVEEMPNFLKRINHEKADEILDYEFDEVKFKLKTPKYTLDCGVFTMMHMLCFTGDPFDFDLDLANRRKVYRAEICVALGLAEINTERKSLVEKVSRFRVVRKLEQEKEVKDMIYVSDF
uniref:Ubiquitin-like protease family profile domain-containing protein n=1 Tax=Chenopodium quinoa TaxID=63459 RepID=A0A803N9Y3_CHEQI